MKKIIILAFICVLLLLVGCVQEATTTQNQTTAPATTQQSTVAAPICGNGINETGETYQNCCQDAGCPVTFKCTSKFEVNQTVYFCAKVEKKDTFESGKIQQILDDISIEGNKEASLIDYNKITDKLAEMKNYTGKLTSLGYDTDTEEFIYKASEGNHNANIVGNQTYANYSTMTLVQYKSALAKDIQDTTNLISFLESLKSQYSANLQEAEEVYDYNIDNLIDAWKSHKTTIESLKSKVDKGIKADISIEDVTKDCYSAIDRAAIWGIKVKIENTGGFDFDDPKVDVSVYSGITLVGKDTESIYNTIVAGQTIYEDLTPSISNLKCGTYKIKVEFRDGADPTVYSSDEATVDIE